MDTKYVLGQKNESVSDTEEEDYEPEQGKSCGCIPKAKPPGKGGHGTAQYVTNLLVPMNVPMKDYPPGFNMTKEGGKHNLEITENRLKFITLKAPVNETLDRADVERVAQAV